MNVERKVFRMLTENQRQSVVLRVLEHDGGRLAQDCRGCAACCVAFSSKGKNNGEKCPELKKQNGRFSCNVYEERPRECRGFDCEGMRPRKGRQRTRLVELLASQELLIGKKS